LSFYFIESEPITEDLVLFYWWTLKRAIWSLFAE